MKILFLTTLTCPYVGVFLVRTTNQFMDDLHLVANLAQLSFLPLPGNPCMAKILECAVQCIVDYLLEKVGKL